MKKLLVTTLLAAAVTGGQAQVKHQSHGYPIDPVPFTSVKVTDSFWGQRLKASREVTIPLAFSKCEETGRYRNFINAAHPSDTIKVGGLAFDDTDVYKTIEGASYLLQTYPDKKLAKYIDSVLVIVAAAQEPDGYLYTSRTMNPKHPHEWAGSKRWEKVEELSHEFYNLGHMVEGAIAHYQATGKRNFLDIAIRYADCVCREIGSGPGQQVRVPGHQIAEMALAKLYLVTGQQKYLDQAKFFLDQRGHTSRTDEYSQAHKPVTEQDEAVGHAVRAAYMYAGMADVAALTGDSAYINAIDRIWDNIVGKKYYITGGIGATSNGEAFGKNYELPNMSAYCETCAAIGNVYVNYRLFREEIAARAKHRLVNAVTGEPLRVVEHIGCHYAKIFPKSGIGGSEFPYVLAGMIESWGGEVVDYPERRHCCGFGFRNYLVQANRGYSIANSHKKLESMAPYKPDFIVANCPGCAMFLDKWQYAIAEMEGTTYGQNGHGIPVLTYEEMAGLVLGYDPWELGMQMHQVDVEPLLDKMGVEYDPAAKYLGRNGKYIGKPESAVVNCCPTDTIYDIRE